MILINILDFLTQINIEYNTRDCVNSFVNRYKDEETGEKHTVYA